jgi:hypothetical protein
MVAPSSDERGGEQAAAGVGLDGDGSRRPGRRRQPCDDSFGEEGPCASVWGS